MFIVSLTINSWKELVRLKDVKRSKIKNARNAHKSMLKLPMEDAKLKTVKIGTMINALFAKKDICSLLMEDVLRSLNLNVKNEMIINSIIN